MAQPKYYDLTGNEVFFYHPVDALEALDMGTITTKAPGAKAPKKEEAPKVEEVKEEEPKAEEEVAPEAPVKKAPRRRTSA